MRKGVAPQSGIVGDATFNIRELEEWKVHQGS
jgi:hypothetical protein